MTHDAQLTVTPPAEPARSAAAKRMHLYRERRRKGLRCLMIELRETEIDALVRMGLLRPEMRNDASAITEALYVHFDRTLP
jgi:predicted N-formylglutamate amidohydrolase